MTFLMQPMHKFITFMQQSTHLHIVIALFGYFCDKIIFLHDQYAFVLQHTSILINLQFTI